VIGMSYELIGILLLGAGQLITLITAVFGLRTMGRELATMGHELARSFQEITRIQRAVAGLVVQESEKVQALLRP
jgi:hypothetical protein